MSDVSIASVAEISEGLGVSVRCFTSNTIKDDTLGLSFTQQCVDRTRHSVCIGRKCKYVVLLRVNVTTSMA